MKSPRNVGGALRAYPDYKPSGVEWLGDVPAHWEVLPNRAVFAEANERNHPEEQMLSVTITQGVIRQKTLLEDSSKKDASRLDRSAYKLVCPGDIAYNKMRAWQGAVGVSEYKGIVSPAYVVQRPRSRACSRYLHYLLRTPMFAKEAERWSYGIASDMWSLRPEHFKMIYSCIPPLAEQNAIVRYLDHVGGRIGRYIRGKEKLVGLLAEEKQAVIHQAVTRGLDANVRLKPSGVEWLGDIPAHWEVRRLKSLCSQSALYGANIPANSYTATGVRFLRTTDIMDNGRLKTGGVFLPDDQVHGYILSDGDLLISRSGTIGRSFLYNKKYGKCAYAGYLVRFVLGMGVLPKYVFLFTKTRAFDEFLRVMAISSTIENVNAAKYANCHLPFPPLAEQTAIAAYLDREAARIDAAAARARRQIELMREYRERLIADVVTGKLDVRGAAAKLPDGDEA